MLNSLTGYLADSTRHMSISIKPVSMGVGISNKEQGWIGSKGKRKVIKQHMTSRIGIKRIQVEIPLLNIPTPILIMLRLTISSCRLGLELSIHSAFPHTRFSRKTTNIELGSTKAIVDTDTAQRIGISESLKFLSRWPWAAKCREFQNWVSSSRPESLSIMGHSGTEKVSPLSFLVSRLHDRLAIERKQPNPDSFSVATGGKPFR
jgi:hypothetical protein